MKINVKKIRAEMERAGIRNNAELGERLGMSRQAIDYIFAQRTTTFKTLNRIANVLVVDGKDLVK